MRRLGFHGWIALVSPLLPVATRAAEAARSGAEKLRGFGLAPSNSASPGYGRVLVAFLLVVGLAWGATWLLRRYGAKLPASIAGGATAIRHLARHSLAGGITCHLVETQGRQVLITVTRHGVDSLLLGEAPLVPGPPP
jgi:hypothetical protein